MRKYGRRFQLKFNFIDHINFFKELTLNDENRHTGRVKYHEIMVAMSNLYEFDR